ncbi:MAG TPA: heme ABC exporter ATP-binding protein CcmA [Actinomycetota bacterium]|nr:heme ABC exporter ATP-binding protein CcmA [Actinomycetota bacterium]
MIRVEGVRVAFGRTVALEHVDLEAGDGVVGVFGQNGSGKTTLLRVVAGLLQPSAGRVVLDGEPVWRGGEDVRRRIGYAGHAPGLYGQLTVAENVELFARLHGAPDGAAAQAIDALGLGDRAGTRVGELSAGLRRRAGVARALVHDPDVLLLDEPYANLDDDAAELVSAALRAWRGPERVALVATHGAKRLKSFADAGLILQRGRVVTYGRYRARTQA